MSGSSEAPPAAPKTSRVFGLDVMRSAAILLVVLGHAMLLLRFHYPVGGWAVLSGIYGVEIFFVLSGFLIGGILLHDLGESPSASTLSRFWIRRWFRTLPNYYLFLILNIMLAHWLSSLPADLWKYPFFVQSFCTPMGSKFFTESWSLVTEEWFYLITPVLIFALIAASGCKLKHATLWTIGFIIAGVSLGRLWYVTLPANGGINGVGVTMIFRLDACMFGVLGAWIKHYHPSLWKRAALFCTPLGLCIIVGTVFMFRFLPHQTSIQLQTNFYTLSSLGALLLLPALDAWRTTGAISSTIFTRLSIWSYSAYLINFPLFLLTYHFFGKQIHEDSGTALSCALGCVVATVLLAAFNYRFFEHPIMQLRDRFASPTKK